jgi:type IV pilus assembly protein PilW
VGLAAGDLAVIADCDAARLFTVTAVADNGGGLSSLQHQAGLNINGSLRKNFGANGTLNQVVVSPFQSNIYYVADTGLENENGDRITALYKQSLPYNDPANPPTELIQGVENMRIAFGVRNVTGSLSYVQPDDPAFNPRQVETIRIGLLMVSWERIAKDDDTNTYVLAGQTIDAAAGSADGSTHPQDKRYRLAFNTTINVRNRRPQSIL